MNHVFGSDIRLEGITRGDKPSIITSQEWAHPADERTPLPSELEVEAFMKSLGFQRVPDSTFEWCNKSDRMRVSDARIDNFIKSKEGILPIDLIVGYEDEI